LPRYISYSTSSAKDPPAITHPGFSTVFVGVTLVWQIAFLSIAQDPVRFRPLMIPAILEKLAFSVPVMILVRQNRMHSSDLVFAAIDLFLGLLFLLAYLSAPRTQPH
jgi:hypothetical protein